MAYNLTFKDQTVDPAGKAPVLVAVGTTNSTSTDLTFTGKGAANHGLIQQQNLIRLLENFASDTEPTHPTVGQIWYDSGDLTLKVLTDASPRTWKSLGGVQVTDVGAAPPAPAAQGDIWYEKTGSGSGFLYVYTGLGRYPTTATTIGGWDQVYPAVEIAGGRDEYDSIRLLVEQIAGDAGGAYGSGAIGRLITNLTNFGALDLNLRQKYDALATANGVDPIVLLSSSSDQDISTQAVSTTASVFADVGSPNDTLIGGLVVGQQGTILLNGAVVSLPYATFNTSLLLNNAWIMYDTSTSIGGQTYLAVQRLSDGTWQYDSGSAFVTFTPTSAMHIIGTISTLRVDGAGNSVYPGVKSGILWAHAVPIIGVKTSHLKVEPNSQDWDTLLAAAKYALNRLEIPQSLLDSISPVPFVTDGRLAHSSLTSLPISDVRYPSAARRSRRKVGTIAQVQNFTETVNALNAGIASRFSIKGINGATGSNPNFASTTALTVRSTHTNTVPGGSGSLRVGFRFADFMQRSRFLFSGGAIEVAVEHIGGSNVADTNFRALLAQANTFRLTADKTRIFGPSTPLTMSRPTVNIGLWNANLDGIALTTITVGSATLIVYAIRVDDARFAIEVGFNAGGALGGTTTVTFGQITSNETYPGPSILYPAPLAHSPTDVSDPL